MPHGPDTIADFAQGMGKLLKMSVLTRTSFFVKEMPVRFGKAIGIYAIPL